MAIHFAGIGGPAPGPTFGSGIVVSESGLPDWTVTKNPDASFQPFDLAWGSGRCVIVGYGSTLIWTTDDFVAFTPRPCPLDGVADAQLTDVVWTGTAWVAVGNGFSQHFILTSPDGVTWSIPTLPSTDAVLFAVASSGSTVVAVGGDLATYRQPRALVSVNDGATWAVLDVSGCGVGGLNAVAHLAGKWLLGGFGALPAPNYALATSTDLAVWSSHDSPFTANNVNGFASDGSRLSASGGTAGGGVITSVDGGTTWVVATTGAVHTSNDIAYRDGLWLGAAVVAGNYLVSYDGAAYVAQAARGPVFAVITVDPPAASGPANDNFADATVLDCSRPRTVKSLAATTVGGSLEVGEVTTGTFSGLGNVTVPGDSVWYKLGPRSGGGVIFFSTVNPSATHVLARLYRVVPGAGSFHDLVLVNSAEQSGASDGMFLTCHGGQQGRSNFLFAHGVDPSETYYLQVGTPTGLAFAFQWVFDQWPTPSNASFKHRQVCPGPILGTASEYSIRYYDLVEGWMNPANGHLAMNVDEGYEQDGSEDHGSVWEAPNSLGGQPAWLGYTGPMAEEFNDSVFFEGNGAADADGTHYVLLDYEKRPRGFLHPDNIVAKVTAGGYDLSWIVDPALMVPDFVRWGGPANPDTILLVSARPRSLAVYSRAGVLLRYFTPPAGWAELDFTSLAVSPLDGKLYGLAFSDAAVWWIVSFDPATGTLATVCANPYPTVGIEMTLPSTIAVMADGTLLSLVFATEFGTGGDIFRVSIPSGALATVPYGIDAMPNYAVTWGRALSPLCYAEDGTHLYLSISTYPTTYPALSERTGLSTGFGRDFVSSVYWANIFTGVVEHRFDLMDPWPDTVGDADHQLPPPTLATASRARLRKDRI